MDKIVLQQNVQGIYAEIDTVAIGALKAIDFIVPHDSVGNAFQVYRVGIDGPVSPENSMLTERSIHVIKTDKTIYTCLIMNY